MSLLAQLDQKVAANGSLIISYQPVPDNPLDRPGIVTTMTLAAEQAGAVVIHIGNVASLQTVHTVVGVPIIGIMERDLEDPPVHITAYIEDVDALAQAGANIITINGTDRPCPMPVETLLARIHHYGLLAMTDCSTPEDGLACQKLGAEIIGTTLSGYTTPETPEEPDLALVETLGDAGCWVIAEGHYNTPAQVADTMYHGTWAVTVGSVITCLEYICQWYNTTIKKAVLWPHWRLISTVLSLPPR